MEASAPDVWQRVSKTTGLLGGLAVILVIFASRLNGVFDWRVFGLSGLAVLLAWSQSWRLVPIHLRHKDAEDAEWQRYLESDWRFVESISGLSGGELDALKEIFRHGDDAGARAAINRHFPAFSSEDEQEFLRFFNDVFMDTVSAYIDDTGRLQAFD
ncbi:MAG: hypothetical protein KJO30_10860 [Boseongicola sp.]|nr:hypothetical protein [Boseongicola sp.]NNJ69247.1 hypothetical protein [Boseongicola sp.]